jgi:double-stranded uracil-DNA glycosylase
MTNVLPDYLAPGLRAVFCGTAVGTVSAARGHYYAGPGNEFWPLLHRSGLLPVRLAPEQDADIVRYGLGLTDLAKRMAASRDELLGPDDFDVPGFVRKMQRYRPAWVVFHGKTPARVVSRALGHGSDVRLGRQAWTLAGRPVFVLPSASAANRSIANLEGEVSRVDWFVALASLLAPVAGSVAPGP